MPIFLLGVPAQQNEVFVLPEFEIVTEPEEDFDESEPEQSSVTNSEVQCSEMDTELDTDGAFAEVVDKQFQKFKTLINRDPEQVSMLFFIT